MHDNTTFLIKKYKYSIVSDELLRAEWLDEPMMKAATDYVSMFDPKIFPFYVEQNYPKNLIREHIAEQFINCIGKENIARFSFYNRREYDKRPFYDKWSKSYLFVMDTVKHVWVYDHKEKLIRTWLKRYLEILWQLFSQQGYYLLASCCRTYEDDDINVRKVINYFPKYLESKDWDNFIVDSDRKYLDYPKGHPEVVEEKRNTLRQQGYIRWYCLTDDERNITTEKWIR